MSLRLTLTLAFLLACTGVLAGLGWLGHLDSRNHLEARLAQTTASSATRLERTLREPLWSLDRDEMRELILGELEGNEDLAWVAADPGTGPIEIAVRGPDGQPRLATAMPPAPDGAISRLVHRPETDGQVVGKVTVAISRAAITAELDRQLRATLVQIACLDGVLALLVWMVLHRVLLARVRALAGFLDPAPETRAWKRGDDEVDRLVEGARALLGRLGAILDAIGDGVVTTDSALVVERVNPAAMKLLGQRDAYTGKALAVLFDPLPGGRALAARIHEEVVVAGNELHLAEPIRVAAADGRPLVMTVSVFPIRSTARTTGAIIVLRDVGEQLRIEERLRQAQKMEAVGRLAGGIAHDFNNALAGMLGYAELLSFQLDDQPRLKSHADAIVRTVERAAGLTRQLLAFSRNQPGRKESVDIHLLVREVIGILEHSIDPGIIVQCNLRAKAPVLAGDPSQLHSMLMNLGVNARDAMPVGGTLTYSTTDLVLDADAAAKLSAGMTAGEHVLLTVADTGSGMTPEVLERLFEPFFTTKPQGAGTGLGMAVVYATVTDHGGAIRVHSAPGEGTSVQVWLPHGATGTVRRPVSDRPHSTAGAERILVVDDEADVRAVALMTLGGLGYRVEGADGAVGALERVRADPRGFDLIVLDMVMPEMTGDVLHRHLRALRADLPMVVATGFAREAQLSPLLVDPLTIALDKPYRAHELGAAVETLLKRCDSAHKPQDGSGAA